jgi:outer membrane biosynthesis protein TonB
MPLFTRRLMTPDTVEAEQIGPGGHASPPQGQRPPRVGDWMVFLHGSGQMQVLSDEDFRAQFEPLVEAAPEPAPEPPPPEPEPEPIPEPAPEPVPEPSPEPAPVAADTGPGF